MTQFTLSGRDRRLLEALVAQTTAATVLRRGQALLWVASGASVPAVAQRLYVTRQAIYKWIRLFEQSSSFKPRRPVDAPVPYKATLSRCWTKSSITPRVFSASIQPYGPRRY